MKQVNRHTGLRSFREIADELHRRTGVRLKPSLVYYYVKRAEAKIRKALEETTARQ